MTITVTFHLININIINYYIDINLINLINYIDNQVCLARGGDGRRVQQGTGKQSVNGNNLVSMRQQTSQ